MHIIEVNIIIESNKLKFDVRQIVQLIIWTVTFYIMLIYVACQKNITGL